MRSVRAVAMESPFMAFSAAAFYGCEQQSIDEKEGLDVVVFFDAPCFPVRAVSDPFTQLGQGWAEGRGDRRVEGWCVWMVWEGGAGAGRGGGGGAALAWRWGDGWGVGGQLVVGRCGGDKRRFCNGGKGSVPLAKTPPFP